MIITMINFNDEYQKIEENMYKQNNLNSNIGQNRNSTNEHQRTRMDLQKPEIHMKSNFSQGLVLKFHITQISSA